MIGAMGASTSEGGSVERAGPPANGGGGSGLWPSGIPAGDVSAVGAPDARRLLRAVEWVLVPALAALLLHESWTRRVWGAPYDELWLALVGVGALTIVLVARTERVATGPAPFLALEAGVACVLTDIVVGASQRSSDFLIYRNAGTAFLDSRMPYIAAPLHAYPMNLGNLPFLYPPPTLPLAALLGFPPVWLSEAAWIAGSVAAVLFALRRFGLPWPWAVAALAWPPVFQGLYVGNVAVPAAALFALGPAVGWTLVLGPILKPQDAVPALWLLRTGRWRALAVGVGVLLAWTALTLPLTGIGMWGHWLRALIAYRDSQRFLPGLYGFSLSHVLPYGVFVVVAAVAVVLALRVAGTRGLAALGLVSAIVSPVLWAHGFVVATPAFLLLDAPLLWTAVGLTSQLNGPGWQIVMLLAALPFASSLVGRRQADAWHPLTGATWWPGPSGGDGDAGRVAEDESRDQTATT